MMNKACLYDIGFCFSFNVTFSGSKDQDTKEMFNNFCNDLIKRKTSAIITSGYYEIGGLPFDIMDITVFLYHTYSRRAYDLYYRYGGKDIRSIDPVTIQCLLSGLGVRSARSPEIILLSRGNVI